MFAATKLQIATYLLGVCPFSIAFLVFLNSSVSFVVTDLIGQREKVGDAVGSLGFADELLAVVACPLWGLLSDRIGVRYVCVLGYLVISLALVLFVQAHNVYPQLLLGRLLFSLGGAAASTMVTAVLPAVSAPSEEVKESPEERALPAERTHVSSPSLTSEITITPTRYQTRGTGANVTTSTTSSSASTSRVAGFVGMLTGCGALIALLLFLPLPARFQDHGMTPERALQYSFYIVAAVALVLSLWCFVGLRNLQYEQDRAGTSLKQTHTPLSEHAAAIWRDLAHALSAGFRRSDIALGYAGGFVARASSVGISLFIPLLVNALFLSSHLCDQESDSGSPAGLPDIKNCPRAYVVASEMTGVCEMVALVAAPVFGYASSRSRRRGLPMMMAAIAGIIGYPLFVIQFDPDSAQTGKRALAFLAVSLIGVSQIGAIVCSLAILSNGILSNGIRKNLVPEEAEDGAHGERDALLGSSQTNTRDQSLTPLKGSVAGVYSFYGGAAILFLTKVGGLLFDKVSFGAPFYIMAAFNTVLLVACGILGTRLTV